MAELITLMPLDRALHTAAPNASKVPRLMMTWRFLREG